MEQPCRRVWPNLEASPVIGFGPLLREGKGEKEAGVESKEEKGTGVGGKEWKERKEMERSERRRRGENEEKLWRGKSQGDPF